MGPPPLLSEMRGSQSGGVNSSAEDAALSAGSKCHSTPIGRQDGDGLTGWK
jgi:hypothetical protein